MRRAAGSQLRRIPWNLIAVLLLAAIPALAQKSPWEDSANVIMNAFTTTIARAFGLVAIVVGGLTLAFGDGGGKRGLAGIIFGVGMAIGAVNLMNWMFP